MSNIQNISAQKIPFLLKRQYVEELCANKEMIILTKKNTPYINLIVRFLLNYRMYRTVIFLKKIQILIK